MKRQEICRRTGLTPKALRLYEEKGLIAPSAQGIHNKTRDYSQEDLIRLQMIATLRRAMFTISEIKEMLENPESIKTIFPQYLQWLRAQNQQIEQLLAAFEQVDLDTVKRAEDLTRQIEAAARNLPIPASDIKFRFRELDSLEARRPDFTTEQKLDQLLPGDRSYRASAVAISRDKLDNTLAMNTQLNDTRTILQEESGRPVADSRPNLKGWQRAIRWGFNGLIVLFLWIWWESYFMKWPLLGLIPAVLVRAALAWKDHRTGQRQWAERMGWTQAGADRKKILKYGLLCILALAAVVGMFAGIAELIWPVEPVDGPPTDGLDIQAFFDEMPGQVLHMPLHVMEQHQDFPAAYAVAPNKIYFLFGATLYSIDADYTDLTKIDNMVYRERGARAYAEESLERPSVLIYADGYIYYIARANQRFSTNSLMAYGTGTKIKPMELYRSQAGENNSLDAIGLHENGKILCYHRADGGTWTELQQVDKPEK